MKKVSYQVQTLVLVAVAFVLGCNEFMVVGILSDLAHSFQLAVATVGLLVTMFALLYALSTPVITLWIGRFDRYTALLSLMIVFILGNTLSALAPSYSWLVVSRLICALVAGVIISLALTFANTLPPRHKRATVVSWVFSGFSIASVFGVPLGTAITHSFGWRFAFGLITVLATLTLIGLMLTLPHEPPAPKTSFKHQLAMFSDQRISIGILIPFFGAAGIYVVYTYIQPLLTRTLGFSFGQLNGLLLLYGIGCIISNQLSGRLVEWGGLTQMPKAYGIEILLLISLTIVVPAKWLGLVVLLELSVVMYLLNSPIQLHFATVAEEDYPDSLVLASSLNSIFFNFGISLGSATGSLVVKTASLKYLGVVGAFYCALALMGVVMVNVRNKQVAVQRVLK